MIYCNKTKQFFSEEELVNEEWRDIPGFEGHYQVSNLGRVKGLKRIVVDKNNMKRPISEKIIFNSTFKNSHNIRRVQLSLKGKYYLKTVHSLVLLSFIGERPKNYDVCHNDGNPSNNRLSNLRYDTRKNNQADRLIHGTMLRGEDVATHKLNTEDIFEIVKLYKTGNYSQQELAIKFYVSRSLIEMIVQKKRWCHLFNSELRT